MQQRRIKLIYPALCFLFVIGFIADVESGTVASKTISSNAFKIPAPKLPQYHVILLDDQNESSTFCDVYNMNNAGFAVGMAMSSSGDPHAFVWDKAAKSTDLGTLNGNSSLAADINDRGEIVGGSAYDPSKPRSYHAFLLKNVDSKMIDLGTLGGDTSMAWSNNNLSQIVGNSQIENGEWQAFLWKDGMLKDIGSRMKQPYSLAYDINNAGQIVGYSSDYRYYTPLIWEADGSLAKLLVPDKCNGGALALAVNDRGDAVGDCFILVKSTYYMYPIIWNYRQEPQIIDMNQKNGHVRDINNKGEVIGVIDDLDPFLYHPSYGMLNLSKIVKLGPGFRLIAASSINDNSEIAGDVTKDYQTYGALLIPKQ